MRALLEGLEGRSLLSGVAQVSFPNSLPASEMGGAVVNLDVPVQIDNVGDAPLSGTFKLQLVASADQLFSKTVDIKLASTNKKLTIGPGQNATVDLLVKSFPTSLLGDFFLVADLNHTQPGLKIVDLAGSSNATVTITAPKVDLAGQMTQFPATAVGFKPFTFTMVITNNGGKTATGNMQIETGMATDTDGSNFVELTTLVHKINLKPGKSTTIKYSLTLAGGRPLGDQFLIVNVDPNNEFSEPVDPARHVVSATPITVS